MPIIITNTAIKTCYAIKDGKVYYVEILMPCAVSDTNAPFDHLDVTPYLNRRTLCYGTFVDDVDGYSYKLHAIRKVHIATPKHAEERFDAWCKHFGCVATWDEIKALAGFGY